MYRIDRNIFIKGKMIASGSVIELDSATAASLTQSGVAVEVEATQEIEIKPKKRKASK